MTAATIVSGAVAGRAKLRAYVAYTIAISAVIYPVVAGVTWGGGFLGGSGLGFTDFAGGMIVHGVGGIAPASRRRTCSDRVWTATRRTAPRTSFPATR